MNGYGHPLYAASLAEFGEPLRLRASGGSLLVREVPGTPWRDAMGCYPLFCCDDWRRLGADLDALRGAIVTVALVTDPFGDYTPADLSSIFDLVLPFKEHYVVDLRASLRPGISRHHRYYARKALERLSVEAGRPPSTFAAQWTAVYAHLVARRRLTGIKAFSAASFQRQFSVPGLIAITARDAGAVVGAHLWYVQNDVAYSHLAAATTRGYELQCQYATYAFAMEYFQGKVRWLDLGGGAGMRSGDDGLTRFKRGWTQQARMAYFCGRILDHDTYGRLVGDTGTGSGTYFPGYRQGEFT